MKALEQELFKEVLKQLIRKIEADQSQTTEKLLQLAVKELHDSYRNVGNDQLLHPIHD